MSDYPMAKKVWWDGREYDSVLESSWAASLAAWGVHAVHHPGTLWLTDGRAYETDFLLPTGGHWGTELLLEVKGSHRLNMDKVEQLRLDHPDKLVIVGLEPYVMGDDVGEYGGARWEPADYEIEIHGERFISAERVEEAGKPGLKMFRAVRGSDEID